MKEGDLVKVSFGHSDSIAGYVKHFPEAVGECWILSGLFSHKPYYVQTFQYIRPITEQEWKDEQKTSGR